MRLTTRDAADRIKWKRRCRTADPLPCGAILLKIRKIGKYVAYDDVQLLDKNQLDSAFKDLTQIDVQHKSFLELTNNFYRMDLEELLSYLDPSKNFHEISYKRINGPQNFINAFYAPFLNKISMFRT
ncbi:hypothetical protein ANCDUO_02134 [Ancylostoma duodenale]|uniref:Uncharacterized protein n=1 Tax=Ancylostoma duodenale TaxID=51022 RepID=A0A0C2DX76_9BILA|nr:hypothetical protein ANCDUO_02134 [Ancylostoma duodenale]